MHTLTTRQQKMLNCIIVLLNELSKQDIVEDSLIVARVAVDLATVAAQPDFERETVADVAVGFIMQYTMGAEPAPGAKVRVN